MGFFEVFAAALAGFYAVIPSFGVAIILLTIATRILMLPLSIKQTRSMREMQKVQPEVKKIQQKHKGDRQKLNEEMMGLYKDHGVNPLGGCLPILLQFPVLIAIYRVISAPLEYIPQNSALFAGLSEQAVVVYRFLGFHLDCTLVDAFQSRPGLATAACGTGNAILSVLPYVVLIGLMGFTTYYQQRQMQASRTPGDPQMQQMQMMMKIMPVILIVFGIQFPAALVLYWLTTNLWTIVQQRIILGRLGPAPAAPGASEKISPADGKSSTATKGKGARQAAPKKPSQSAGNGAKKSSPKPPNTRTKAASAANKKKRKR